MYLRKLSVGERKTKNGFLTNTAFPTLLFGAT